MSKYLDNSEKILTRSLYEEAFYEDSKKFVDFYYDTEINYNDIIVDDYSINSMIHIHYFNYKNFKIPYLIAVATRKNKRHQGYYSRLLFDLLNDFNLKKIPYVFLMPANENIYLPYGFNTLINKPTLNITLDDSIENNNYCIKEVEYSTLVNFGDIIRDNEYYFRMNKAMKAQNGKCYAIYKSGVELAFIRYLNEEEPTILDIIVNGIDINEAINVFLRYKKLKEIVLEFSPYKVRGKALEHKVKYMFRIVNIINFIKILKYKKDFTLRVNVIDDIIFENNLPLCIEAKYGKINTLVISECDRYMNIYELIEYLYDNTENFIPYLHEVI